MMQATDLRLTFNPGTPIENPALRGINLNIADGEFVTVIGTNGAGKSTFLNAVSGTTRVDSGSILLNGIDVTKKTAHQRAHWVARVFQDPMAGTCEALTIEENMALAYKRGGKRGLNFALNPNNRDLFKEKLSVLKLGLENRLTDRMGLLSGTRTVMLHQGEVVLDVAGNDRKGMDVHDLLDMFEQTRGEKVDDDSLILS